MYRVRLPKVGELVEFSSLFKEERIIGIVTWVPSEEEIIEKLKRITDHNPTVTNLEAKAGELMRSCLDTHKAELNLDFKAEVNLDEGLAKTVEYNKNAKNK